MDQAPLKIAPQAPWQSVRFAAVVCLLVLALSALPPINAFILRLDMIAAFQLNDILGYSPVLDRLIIPFANRRWPHILIGSILLGWGLRSLFAPTRRELASRISMVLFFAVLMSIALLAGEIVEDIAMRKSPSLVLQPFKNVTKFYDTDLRIRDKTSFPAVDAFVYFLLGFSLLRVGRRFGGLVLIAGLVLPLSGCVVGKSWLSDIWLGSLPLALLATSLGMSTWGFRLCSAIDLRLLSALDKSKPLLTRLANQLGAQASLQRDTDLKIEVETKRYIQEDLALELNAPAGAPVRVEIPLSGTSCLVRLVSIGDRHVVVRIYPRSRRHQAQHHLNASLMLQSHNINAPRILHFRESASQSHPTYIVENRIEGISKSPAEMTADDYHSMARELAKLHNVQSTQWGPIEDSRAERFSDALFRKIDRRISDINWTEIQVDLTAEKQMRDWFASWKGAFDDIRQFSLTHNRLSIGNGLFAPDEEYYFLDFASLEWSLPLEDLMKVYDFACNNDPEKIAMFEKAYFSYRGEDSLPQYRLLIIFYTAFYKLTMISRDSKRQKRGKTAASASRHQSAAALELWEYIKTNPSPAAD